MKKIIIIGVFLVFFLLNNHFFKLERIEINDEVSSFVGLTIDGSSTTTFPTKDSGLAIGSIICDKGANGVWDYQSWTLKIRNITQSRTKCQINFVSRYTEGILNGTDPVLKDGLIPVTIDNDGTVKKASLGWEWYDYETRRWANAVILNNETEVYYDGDIIPEEAIESYFVWIPRYKYKIFDMGKYEGLTSVNNKQQTIDVIFGLDTSKDSDSSCKTPNQSGSDGTCSIGKYMTHPAFTSFGTNGMWVGKFETGYKDTETKEEALQNVNDVSKIQIKPNVYSWRNINVSNAYLNSYEYKRSLDSHLMKNTEWGAVAYLQHSKYGSKENLRINNYNEYKTGYSVVKIPECGYTGTNEECNRYGTDESVTRPWNTEVGYYASTTNNSSGIYDMSGGAWEYVMGVLSKDGIPCIGRDELLNSGFNGSYCYTSEFFDEGVTFPNDKRYYDVYEYSDVDEQYERRILGDATGEMGPFTMEPYGSQKRQIGSWHGDEGWFVNSWAPWFIRGGLFAMGTGAGIFSYAHEHGPAGHHCGFRIVLSI